MKFVLSMVIGLISNKAICLVSYLRQICLIYAIYDVPNQ